MSDREKRQKASDVFRESNFLFAQKGTFAEAFPTIEKLRVEVTESGRGVGTWYDGPAVYTETTTGEYVNCSNTLCYNGGFRLGGLLRQMVRNGEKELEVTEFCQGYNGSPKGRRNYGPCGNGFKVKIVIEYKPTIL